MVNQRGKAAKNELSNGTTGDPAPSTTCVHSMIKKQPHNKKKWQKYGNFVEKLCSSYLDFAMNQCSLIFEDFSATSLPFTDRSLMVGISCFAFLMPILTDHPQNAFIWIFQALISFASDYVYAGRPSITHGIDRVYASTMVLYILILSLYTLPLHLLVLVPVLFYVPTIMIVKSKAAAKDKQQIAYEFYHTLWHYLAAPVGTWVVHMSMPSA
mmetsp:Transcript_22741/g.39655  ORF Transcript_22741/g.39655 Transcript_22741/m.39655 type:complete len:212 (+) Transcript_22741:171-806(+)